jgi:hypothetical protein
LLDLKYFTDGLEAHSEAIEIDQTTDEVLVIPLRGGHLEHLCDEPIPSPVVLLALGDELGPPFSDHTRG